MDDSCIDCGANLTIPSDCFIDEIIGCPDCGLDYVITQGDNGTKNLKELMIEGEDWGE